MLENQGLTLENMRKEREKAEAVYIQFANNRRRYKTHAFCFYEGEDGKYYNPRVERKFEQTICYKVGNKREVLKLLDRITSTDLYSNVCVMFFVDRDYDVSMSDYKEELFETPCYSIENLYVQKECVRKILQSEFSLNEFDNDYVKCMHDYERRAEDFNNEILEFNALAYLRRKRGLNYSFGSVKTSHMIKVEVNKVSKSNRYDNTINRIKEELKFDNGDIEKTKNELKDTGDFMSNFRGKNQLDFLVEFIKDLKRLNDIGGYFSVKRNSVHINITLNRLSELSQYAITPPSLERFLEKHKEKFLAVNAS